MLIEMTKNMTLKELLQEVPEGSKVRIKGNGNAITNGSPEVYRPRLAGIFFEDATLLSDSQFLIGYPNYPMDVYISRCRVGTNNPLHSTDFLNTCNLRELVDSTWARTHNGPVNADRVARTSILDIKSDALSGVLEMDNVYVDRVKGGGGTHPDVHQLYKPNATHPIEIRMSACRFGPQINCQGLHWTVTNGQPVSAFLKRVEVARVGNVWVSRIACPLDVIEMEGCKFDQPLIWSILDLRRGYFHNCTFKAFIVEGIDVITKGLLNSCSWKNCSFETTTGHNIYVPEGAR